MLLSVFLTHCHVLVIGTRQKWSEGGKYFSREIGGFDIDLGFSGVSSHQRIFLLKALLHWLSYWACCLMGVNTIPLQLFIIYKTRQWNTRASTRQAEGVEKEVCCYLASDWWVGLCFHVSVCDSVVSYVGEKENSHIFGSLHSPSLTQTSSSSMKCHHFEDSMSLFEEIQ